MTAPKAEWAPVWRFTFPDGHGDGEEPANVTPRDDWQVEVDSFALGYPAGTTVELVDERGTILARAVST